MIRMNNARLPAKAPRTRAKAVAPPVMTASEATMAAMRRLMDNAARQSSLAKNFSYHCQEKPGGGKTRKGEALKDRMTMTASGASMNRIIASAYPRSRNGLSQAGQLGRAQV